jgi:hypothetical protein
MEIKLVGHLQNCKTKTELNFEDSSSWLRRGAGFGLGELAVGPKLIRRGIRAWLRSHGRHACHPMP